MPSVSKKVQRTVGLSKNRDQLKEGSLSHEQLNLDIKPGHVMILLEEMGHFLADTNLAAQIMSVPIVNDIARKNKDTSSKLTNANSPYLPTFLHSVKVHKNPTSRMLNNALLNGTKINGNKREFLDLTCSNSRMFFDYELYTARSNKEDLKEFASASSYKVIKGERDVIIEYRYHTFLQHLLAVEKKGIGTTTGGSLTSMSYIDFPFNPCMKRFIDDAKECNTTIACGRFEVNFAKNQQAEVRFFLEVITKLIPSVLQFITDRISKDDVLNHARSTGNAVTAREYSIAIDNLDSSAPYYSAIINDLNSITNLDPRTGCGVRIKDINYVDMRRYLRTYLPGLYSVLYSSRNVLTMI